MEQSSVPRKHRSASRTPSRHKTYFFSDVHLGLGTPEEDRQKEQRLIRFLDFIEKDAEQIIIVGDLFDYWFEYKTVVPKGYFRLFAKLAEIHDRGIRVFFTVGNHDFWMRGYFHDELGMEVYTEPMEKEIHGKRFLIHHGDGLIKNDVGYRILKKILRAKINVFLFALIHPDLTGRIARWSSHTSRQYTSNRAYEGDDMVRFAQEKIRTGFDFVIMGHHHVPTIQQFLTGTYVNLGDWIFENTYAVFDGKKMVLQQWKG
ncbi:MAG TPA: UDP-2,3-diacylglucosamine diphosphatase [Bacteroidota bacterium]|nr:UDP-2,3-diacylglucosamine diphosphatase [Bacteroidota bacterium]